MPFLKRARLTLHEDDPITGNEDMLYSLSYERYRGYTIYSIPDGRCCIHGLGGCLKLGGQLVCLPDSEEAKTLIKRLRAEGYSCSDNVERYLPEWEVVWLNRGESSQGHALSILYSVCRRKSKEQETCGEEK